MAVSRRDMKACLDDVVRAGSRLGHKMDRYDAEQILGAVKSRLDLKKTRAAAESAEARATQAAGETSEESTIIALVKRRNKYIDLVKRIDRDAGYEAAPAGGGKAGYHIGLEAKLIGSDRAFRGAGDSVEATHKGLLKEQVIALTLDLENANLYETVRSGRIDRLLAREMEQLNMKAGEGKPGITGSAEALQAARIINSYQKLALDRANQAGAWISQYEGYVARTAHDGDRLRRATYPVWRDFVMQKLDLEKTFGGIADQEKFLEDAYHALVTGQHFTLEGMKGFKDPAFTGASGNVAKQMGQSRQLHWKNADAWMDYQEMFGGKTLMENVLQSLNATSRNTALMQKFGTAPRAEFEADIDRLIQRHRNDDPEGTTKLANSKQWLSKVFDELDGTAAKPVYSLAARFFQGVRTWISMSKLGGVLFSSFADLGNRAAVLNVNGIGFLEAYADGIAAIARNRGAKGSETRQIFDLIRAGADGMVRDLSGRFTGIDTVPGTMSKIANYYFKATGLDYWTNALRGNAEVMLARHLGQNKALEFAKLPADLQRQLPRWNVGEAEWNALRTLEWRQADGKIYLTPDIAMRLSDDQVDALLRAQPSRQGQQFQIDARARDEYREALALNLHSYNADLGTAAVLEPGAWERAFLRQGTQAGTVLGEALRLFAQFKAFPVAMVTKIWPRLIHGKEGMGRVGATIHMMAASLVFGYLGMSAKDIVKGREPRSPTDPKTYAAAFLQGGAAGIYGDYLFGEFSRFGKSASASIMGPVLGGGVEDALDLWHRVTRRDDVAAKAIQVATSYTPFLNLFYVKPALDYLVLYQIQEALNPGWLHRMERRVEKENSQKFWLRPSSFVGR
jgi:hypothetical protein